MLRKVFLDVLVFILIVSFMLNPAYAGWVDDWIQQKTETSPGYFEGQKRGYMTTGSFSARWYNSNDYLFTAEPPRVKAGCGGIDVFLGGFSFLNFDYLVQKLQRILQSAPAAAFDIALNVLCEPCSKTIKSLEAITDALNSIQLDDCKASKVLVAKAFDALGSDNSRVKAEAESNFMLGSGIEDLREKIKKIWETNDNQFTRNTGEQTAGCPTELNIVFNTPNTTVLQAIGRYRGYPDEYIDLARGFIGDVLIVETVDSNGSRQNKPIPIPPCPENKPDSIENFFTGNAYMRPANGGACTRITDVNANLVEWSSNKLLSIEGKIRNSQPLSDDEQAFINNIPLPVFSALKMAVSSYQSGAVIGMLSSVSARAYAFGMVSDLYNMAGQSIHLANSLIAKKGQKATVNCQVELIEPVVAEVKKMLPYIHGLMSNIYSDYARVAVEASAINTLVERYEKFENIVSEKMSQSFRPSVIKRATGG